jgi:hypothetical protein
VGRLLGGSSWWVGFVWLIGRFVGARGEGRA